MTKWADVVKARDVSCRHCGSSDDLHAHHIKPRYLFPDLVDDLDNGLTLCRRCHAKEHGVEFGNIVLFSWRGKQQPRVETDFDRLVKSAGMSKAKLARTLGFNEKTASTWKHDPPGYAVAYLELLIEFNRARP